MTVKSNTLGPGTFSIGSVGTPLDLTAQVTNLRVEFSEDVEDSVPTLSGETLEGEASYPATLTGTLVQDLTEEGMFDYTWSNKGTIVPFTFTPSTAAGRTVTGSCRVAPLNLGGDVKVKNTTDFTWSIIGDPVLGDDL
jgi:hypothetical protein